VAGVLVGSIATAQQSPSQAPEPIPILQQKGARQNPVDAILEHVETGHDGWLSELYDEEVKVQLGALKKVLAHKPVDREKLSHLVAENFRGTSLAPVRLISVRTQAPAVWRYEPAKDYPVTAESLAQEIGRWLANLDETENAELKTTAIQVLGDNPPQVRLWIRYDLVGHSSKRENVQYTGHWMTEWRKEADRGWLWTGLVVEDGWESRADRALFADITTCALPAGPATDQLLRGIDWFSNNLDAATGVDIYGNNGVAVADVDGDGREDFYVCQPSGLPNRLFRANGDGTFREIAREAGVDLLDRSSAAVFFDYENDGDPDLLIAGNELLLFQNDGNGRFDFVPSARAGLTPLKQEKAVFTSTCVADFDRDSFLDIYVAAYAWQVGEVGYRLPVPYHDAQNGPPNFLFRNQGDGTFRDVTHEAGLDQNNNRFSFACSWADYDKNGYPDLYVANDFGRNNLYQNDGGRFRDVAPEAGVEDIGAGMSVAWEDYDNDGWLDLYIGNMYSTAGLRTTMQPLFKPGTATTLQQAFRRHAKGNTLFRNRGDGTFEDVSEAAGVAMGRWAWSSNFVDVDLDGRQDIYITNGYITNESTKDL
jgi:hypothetical protein